MIVQDLLRERKEIFRVPEDMTVHEASRYLREHQVRAVGVLDAAGRLVGALSQSDISDKVAAENKCPAWMRVSEIMTRDLVTVTTEETLDECLRSMEIHSIFHLLVVDAAGGFCGMISVADLLRLIASDHKARADMFEAMIFPQR
jgi:CBS domain-containing protein